MKRGAWAALLTSAFVIPVGVFCAMALAQRLPWQAGSAQASSLAVKHAQDVRYVFPDQVRVEANRDAAVELHFRVRPGMHINSHTPSSKFLIATKLTFHGNSGVKVLGMTFPAGEGFTLAADPGEKLNVYSGEFAVRARVRTKAGQHILQGSLKYQACDTNSCYPPREAPVAVDVIAR